MKKFYIYIKKWKVYELIKVIECRTEQEAYNRYAYLNDCVGCTLVIKKKLMEGLNVENGSYKE